MVKHPANMNIDLGVADDSELNALIKNFPERDIEQAKGFRTELYNWFMDYAYKITDKRARRKGVDVALLFSSVAFAALDLCMTYCIGLSRRNPAAGELLKRMIKDTVSKWK